VNLLIATSAPPESSGSDPFHDKVAAMRLPRSATRALPLLLPLILAPVAYADEPAAASAPKVAAPAPNKAPAQVAKTTHEKSAKHHKKAKKRDIKGPVANFPGFRMLSAGESRVSVEISEKVDVTEHKAEGRIAYRMKGVSVPTKTNRLPLETMFFQTPVGRIQLVELDEGDVDLVIELRQASTPTYKLAEAESGFVLEVDFPKPTAAIPPPPIPKGPRQKPKGNDDDAATGRSDLRERDIQNIRD